jgi:hypothetical protein
MTEKKELSFAERYGKRSNFTSSAITSTENLVSEKNKNSNEGFADEISSSMPKNPIDPQKRALAQYIYLVKGVDAGRNAWYYVLVERLKVQLFLKALNDDIIHLENYGKILYSAYGDEPPANITQAIKDEYGVNF